MRARSLGLLFLIGIFSACANSTAVPPTPNTIPPTLAAPAPSAPPPPRTLARTEKIPVVQLTVPPVTNAHPGAHVAITARVEPMILETGRTASGATFTSLTRWENARITEMQFCIETKRPCVPTGEWIPFQGEWQTTIDVEWLGERTYWLGAQFRDASGKIIRGYNPANPPTQLESGATNIVIHSTMDARTPMAAQPAFVQTAIAATRVAYPVTGSLVLQNGMCCAGGKVGTAIEINAAFDASSPNSNVTHMRLLNHCGAQNEMNTAPWEPFVKQKTFPYQISVPNWVGWYLAVQYRDANGDLSPIYCEDISIEGMTR